MSADRERYDSIIAKMTDETLINALLVLGSKKFTEVEEFTVHGDLCAEAEKRFPRTDRLMDSWVHDEKRQGTYAHALVAAIIATGEVK
jgi:hypothetical protein